VIDGLDVSGADIDEDDVVPGLREAATEQAPHGARAEDGDVHDDGCARRWAGEVLWLRYVNICALSHRRQRRRPTFTTCDLGDDMAEHNWPTKMTKQRQTWLTCVHVGRYWFVI